MDEVEDSRLVHNVDTMVDVRQRMPPRETEAMLWLDYSSIRGSNRGSVTWRLTNHS